MVDAARVPRSQAAAVISRIKILADLDISERRLPQDGRIGLDLEGRRVDIRVADACRSSTGESAVLRILDSGHAPLSLDDLGMSAEDRARLESSLRAHARRDPRDRPDRLRQDDDAVRGDRRSCAHPRRR